MLEARVQSCQSAKEKTTLINKVKNLESEYNSYDRKYKNNISNENLDSSNLMSAIESKTDEDTIADFKSPRFDISDDDVEPTFKQRRRKSLHNIYKNIANYGDVIKKMRERDLLKFAQAKANNPRIYDKEISWLYRMKVEVAKTAYGIGKNRLPSHLNSSK